MALHHLTGLGVIAEYLIGPEEELRIVAGAASLQRVLVVVVERQHAGVILLLHLPGLELHVVSPQPPALAALDEGEDVTRRELLRLEPAILEEPLHEALLVRSVVDREGLPEPRAVRVLPEEPRAERVEGADPHVMGNGLVEHPREPRADLARRLVGEGDGHDLPLHHVLDRDEPGNPAHEHPGLAGARPREHEQVGPVGSHRLSLAVIEGFDYVFKIHMRQEAPVPHQAMRARYREEWCSARRSCTQGGRRTSP